MLRIFFTFEANYSQFKVSKKKIYLIYELYIRRNRRIITCSGMKANIIIQMKFDYHMISYGIVIFIQLTDFFLFIYLLKKSTIPWMLKKNNKIKIKRVIKFNVYKKKKEESYLVISYYI